ncbi:MAG: hypothetical protein EOO88_30695, partial [Pedobacter sp.]
MESLPPSSSENSNSSSENSNPSSKNSSSAVANRRRKRIFIGVITALLIGVGVGYMAVKLLKKDKGNDYNQ